MYKVIFRVQKLLLKLNNVDCQIHAKKGSLTISLTSSFKIQNGQASIGIQTEFFILQNDPLFMIQVSLLLKGSKKLGGQISLNVGQWDQNVHHSTVASLQNSPDRNAQIHYTFFYLKKSDINISKSLILCSEYRNKNLIQIQSIKKELTKKHDQLQGQVKRLKQQNKMLINSQKNKKEEMDNKKTDHEQRLKDYSDSIQKNNQRNKNLKKTNQQIMKMIKKFGNAQTISKLQNKYPQKQQKMSNSDRLSSQQQKKSRQSDQEKRKNSSKTSSSKQQFSQTHSQVRQRSRQKRFQRKSNNYEQKR